MPAQKVPPEQTRSQLFGQRHHHWRNTVAFWAFVGPTVIGLSVFTYLPILMAGRLSLYRARLTIAPKEFIGLENYQWLLKNPTFVDSLKTIFWFSSLVVPLTFSLALILALLVNRVKFGRGLFRTVFFVPITCSYVVASLVWRMSIFSGLPSGVANMVLWEFGQNPVTWIGMADPPYHWLALVSVRLWLQAGFFMLLFIAALQDIPDEIYEAAQVDGAATGWQTFRFITFPLIQNTSVAVLLLLFIQAIQAFDEFYNILGGVLGTQSGNFRLANTPLIYLHRIAIADFDYGRGSAGAFIITFLTISVALIQGRVVGFGQARD